MADTGGKYSPITRDSNLHSNTDRTLRFPVTNAAGTPINTSTYTLEWTLYDSSGVEVLTVPDSAISQDSDAGTNDRVLVPWTATGVAYANENVAKGRGYSHQLLRTDAGSREVLAYGPVEIVGVAS